MRKCLDVMSVEFYYNDQTIMASTLEKQTIQLNVKKKSI